MKLHYQQTWVALCVVAMISISCTLSYQPRPSLTPQEQVCGLMEGEVPRSARERFLHAILRAIEAQNDEWLTSVSEENALAHLEEVRPLVTDEYEIVFLDDLAGTYEYRVHFSNGSTVYIVLLGTWQDCPDHDVTEEEIFTNIKLATIWVESK